MSEPIYHLHDLAMLYGDRTVLQVGRLDIGRGEVLALVGPSGAGKSTLLRLLNFLEPPTRGRIEFDGRTFSAERELPIEQRRRVTTVFQRPLLLNRSVEANVRYGLSLRNHNKEDERVRQALQDVGLEALAGQRARTLSGGEAQRVALARAMVLKPDVLLLDEPTANLDPYNVGLIEDIVQQLNRAAKTTVVLVTHNVFQAKRLADRVALILEGQLIEVSDVGPFFEAPADPRTEAFVRGDMVY